MRRSPGDQGAAHVRDCTLVSPVSILPARGGASAGGRVRGPISATDEAVVLGGHPLPDPASRADPHHLLAREGGDGFHEAARILRRAAEDHGTVAPVVQLSLLGRDGGPIRGEHGTTSRTPLRSEEHTSELQSRLHLVCRLLLEKKKKINIIHLNQHTQSYNNPRSW